MNLFSDSTYVLINYKLYCCLFNFLVEMTYFIQLQVAISLKYNRNSNTLRRNGKTTLFITSRFSKTLIFFLTYDFPMFVITHSI